MVPITPVAMARDDRAMVETPFFFRSGEAQLFGIVHQPSSATMMPYVFCHPFGEDKLWSHRVFVSFARELARRGHPVLRFDYMGNGDSEGAFASSSVETGLTDIGCAVDWLRERTGVPLVGLLGLRFGATLAALVAERRDDIGELVLWAPLVDGSRYMQELLRTNLATQMAVYREIRADRSALTAALEKGSTVNVDGYEISFRMFSEMSAIRLGEAQRRFSRRCLITQIERAAGVRQAQELERLQERTPRSTLSMVQEEPFWKEIERFYASAPHLFADTLAWMESHDGGGQEADAC